MARNSTVTVDLVGDATRLSNTFDEAEGKAKGFGSKVGSILGAVGGVAAAKGLFDFGKASVEAFKESEDSAARLQDAFDKFPKLADSNVAAFDKLNASLAKKTKFDDDATASGQAVLAQFGLTGKQIEQLTPLLQDYAAKTGKDIPGAAEVLGKAMIGNAKALKEVGISIPKAADFGKAFDAAQSKVEATTATLENAQRRLNDLKEVQATKDKLTVQDQIALRNAQEAVAAATEGHSAAVAKMGRIQENAGKQVGTFDQIMGGLRQQVGGFAEKEGQTAAGKAAILSNQFGELQETVGSKLMPVLTTLADWLLRIINFVSNLSPGMQTAIAVAVGLAGAAFLVVQAVQAWTSVQAALNVVMSANPIGLVVVAIAALVAGLIWAYGHVDWFRAGVQSAFAGMVAAGQWLANVFTGVWNSISVGFHWLVGVIKDRINFVIRLINGLLGGLNKVSGGLNKIPGVNLPTFGAIPELAKGGIVSSPTLAMIGEAGPEAVVPLSRGGGQLGGGNITVNFNGVTTREAADQVVRILNDHFGRGGGLSDGRGGVLRPV